MAVEPGFIPWLLSLRGGIESQLLKGRMTLKTEFTVNWFLHYISIIFRSNQNMVVNYMQAESELSGKCVSDGLRNRNGQAVVMYWKILN